jgi:hypothetical protein
MTLYHSYEEKAATRSHDSMSGAGVSVVGSRGSTPVEAFEERRKCLFEGR